MTREDFIYLAGLFDGEGCVDARIFVRDGRWQISSSLRITNADPRVLYWLEDEFGGRVYEAPENRTRRSVCYSWYVSGDASMKFARRILPYARIKGEQLVNYIELRKRFVGRTGRGNTVTDAEWRVRKEIVDKIHSDPFRRKAVVS